MHAKTYTNQKLKYLLCILITLLTLTGCSYPALLPDADQESLLNDTWSDSGSITMGHHLTIQNADNRLTLSANMDTLSADGLYYASWTMGNSEPYENNEGDTVNLYDAQLYFVLGEYPNGQTAQKNLDKWLVSARTNYKILTEEEIACNGQSYHLATYSYANEINPYEQGISAFGIYENNAMCIELACRETFDEDLREILINFLNNCTYQSEEN